MTLADVSVHLDAEMPHNRSGRCTVLAMKISGVATAAVAMVMLVAGCGSSGPSAHEKAAAASHKAAVAKRKAAAHRQEVAARARAKAAAERRARQSAVYRECRAVANGLDNRLSELNSRLAVGMAFAEYGDRVGSARVAYDKFIRDAKARGGVSDACVNRVGVPLESALNAYAAAYDVWNNCINATSCDTSTGAAHDKMQAKWSKAGRLVDKADAALTGLQPAG